jgi:molecular chaperone DnaK
MSSNIVGIDLGTTFSSIASLDAAGKPEIIATLDGGRLTPSVVFFPQDEVGKTYVGEIARDMLIAQSSRGVEEIKKHMGNPQYVKRIDGQSYNPEQISSFILRKMIGDAEEIKGAIDSAVITVPANFPESARRATMDAGALAGITVSHIINEPTAAALHYASVQSVAGTIMVYDLGGGTFDATIANIKGQDVECIASQGDRDLGGKDFDRAIYEQIQNIYREQNGMDIVDDENPENYWMMLAEKCKCRLSQRDVVKEIIKGPAGPLTISLSRSDFEEVIANSIARTEALMEVVLDEASMKPQDINAVLLVGGSTRIPALQDSITKIFGKPPLRTVNPDEAVALGAAIYAGKKAPRENLSVAQKKAMDQVQLKEVASHYFGTIIAELGPTGNLEERVATVLKKNAPLPCSVTKTYYTLCSGQEFIDCKVTQSNAEENDPAFVRRVWEGELKLPAAREANMPVEVTYSYDENEEMHVSFKDVESGRKLEANIHPGRSVEVESQKVKLQSFVVE